MIDVVVDAMEVDVVAGGSVVVVGTAVVVVGPEVVVEDAVEASGLQAASKMARTASRLIATS